MKITPLTAARRKVKRPERELRGAIIALLRAHGIAAWSTGVGGFRGEHKGKAWFARMGTKGMSDIVGLAFGRFIAIEVKNPAGRVSPEQSAFLQDVARHGGIAFVARSLDDVIEKLNIGRNT